MNKFPLLLFVGCLLLAARTVAACDCVGPHGKAALVNAKLAFSGKVIRIKYLDDPNRANLEPRIIVTFSVYRVWKGTPNRRIVLHTVYNRWTCNGYWFKQGGEYLVFAHPNTSQPTKLFPKATHTLGVRTCGGTFPLADAKRDVEELGAGKLPL